MKHNEIYTIKYLKPYPFCLFIGVHYCTAIPIPRLATGTGHTKFHRTTHHYDWIGREMATATREEIRQETYNCSLYVSILCTDLFVVVSCR